MKPTLHVPTLNGLQARKFPDAPVILLAENDDDSRSMLATLLAMKGYRVVEAPDGEAAIKTALDECPGLVILDLSLPRLNGIEVAKRLRSILSTPIIVCSGWDRATYEPASLIAGCSEYLAKPIDFERLDAMLERYLPLPSVEALSKAKRA